MAGKTESTCIEQRVPHLVPMHCPVRGILQTLDSYGKITIVVKVTLQSLANQGGSADLEFRGCCIQRFEKTVRNLCCDFAHRQYPECA